MAPVHAPVVKNLDLLGGVTGPQQSDSFDCGLLHEGIEHPHIAPDHMFDVARHEHEVVDSGGRGISGVAIVLLRDSEQPTPFLTNFLVDRQDPVDKVAASASRSASAASISLASLPAFSRRSRSRSSP